MAGFYSTRWPEVISRRLIKVFLRKKILANGTWTYVSVPWCNCKPGERRGSPGGVCWFGGAIEQDDKSIEELVDGARKENYPEGSRW